MASRLNFSMRLGVLLVGTSLVRAFNVTNITNTEGILNGSNAMVTYTYNSDPFRFTGQGDRDRVTVRDSIYQIVGRIAESLSSRHGPDRALVKNGHLIEYHDSNRYALEETSLSSAVWWSSDLERGLERFSAYVTEDAPYVGSFDLQIWYTTPSWPEVTKSATLSMTPPAAVSQMQTALGTLKLQRFYDALPASGASDLIQKFQDGVAQKLDDAAAWQGSMELNGVKMRWDIGVRGQTNRQFIKLLWDMESWMAARTPRGQRFGYSGLVDDFGIGHPSFEVVFQPTSNLLALSSNNLTSPSSPDGNGTASMTPQSMSSIVVPVS